MNGWLHDLVVLLGASLPPMLLVIAAFGALYLAQSGFEWLVGVTQ